MTYVDSPLVPTVELQPLNARDPCGPSLEYDAEYAVLLSRMSPRGDAQYGQFVGTPEAPNWAEIERDCRRLLLRTRDINLFVWLCRARARVAQAAGLAQSLVVLSEVLERWPDAVHPQLVVEGERDPAVRANALAALADPDGLLGDVREIVVAANAARHLTVREIERAWSVPRLADAPSPESVAQQLAQLRLAANGDADAPVNLLSQALRATRQIVDWAARQLGGDAPSLQALIDLLKPFDEIDVVRRTESVSPREGVPRPSVSGLVPRDDVLQAIRSARQWFENHEPSSPVAVLLKQAERMVGQRFALVANAIPLDLLQKWDSEGERA
ncbi:type VI secretion system protein ImpA [Variovorax boronicumulans]|uniref:Type VI secretion system protein ImpA n=1 Tax=Variovorax boronicumulans TaxID=436515 RepID=A0AAW8D8F8_9BURK|nr:type VI secretion system ImpA family N-terminal domain-containing protein [Variovorax boronicumulans]MDP9896111.1 type VI secretion system protein ImpA [Variovorax boronicumulans]MDQ0056276.1 type VI secretion system protein ImpA [Variovorax boronicumulans]